MTDFLKYINIGIMLVAPAAVGLVIGDLIDAWLGTSPIFTVGLLFLGIFAGIWSMYKSVKNLM